MEPYVDGFVETAAGPVPRVRTHMLTSDKLGTVMTRIGITRADYKVIPGLYCVGNPTPESPVLATANYKLSFDAVRSQLTGIDAWLLVLDTRGINVWCAAGKNLFATHEVIRSVSATRLDEIVAHRELILPQLGATGVAAHKVRKACGFRVIYSTIRAEDLPAFLNAGNQATEAMRMTTFSLKERAELIPVEIYLMGKLLLVSILAGFLLSGIGPEVFSLSASMTRGITAMTATLSGSLAGAVAVPLFLNIIPWRQFWPKGVLTGAIAGILCALFSFGTIGWLESAAITLWTMSISSFLAMNFTGSTPYTSPSGVEAEMRQGIPLQAAGATLAVTGWMAAPFTG